MKKFKFDLQEILDYRKYEEQQAQIELGKALAVENEIQENLNTIARQYAELNASMKNSRNFEDILAQNRNINLLNYQKEELLEQLAAAKIETEEKRQVLQEIMKKTTSLEKVREQEAAEYTATAEAEEENEVEDLTTTRYKFKS